MRRLTSGLRRGRVNRPIDTPVRKLREAEAELARVVATDLSGTETFRHALSAFLAAARSAHKVFRRHAEARYDAWYAGLSVQDVGLMKLFSDARNLEAYQDGPAMGVIVHVGGAPPGARRHHYHVLDSFGTNRMLAVVDLCKRQLELLRQGFKAIE